MDRRGAGGCLVMLELAAVRRAGAARRGAGSPAIGERLPTPTRIASKCASRTFSASLTQVAPISGFYISQGGKHCADTDRGSCVASWRSSEAGCVQRERRGRPRAAAVGTRLRACPLAGGAKLHHALHDTPIDNHEILARTSATFFLGASADERRIRWHLLALGLTARVRRR
ncbi:hypothetical protein RR46_13525 [Papilio xuthus]|uniref:Uncharacterized protein n=1 Tax=Papilio xuthus TaxID=66420 RepID=A0A194PHV4_PAPXU|nr:hypothetical protein RR46_13525 [Papilio xuthus]